MKAARTVRAMGPIDLRNVTRDPLLRWMFVAPLLLGLAFRLLVPVLKSHLMERYQFDLLPYYPLLASFLVLTMPSLAGMVVGFLLLDQKDDRTLSALQVTPLSLTGYLLYRISLPTLLGVAITIAVLPWTGLVELSWGQIVVASFVAAPLAPVFALFLACFSANKVQGFALMKAAGVLNWPPLFAYFVDSNWQLAFGAVPTYWPAKVVWMQAGGESGVWLFVLAALAYQILILWLLARRFGRVMGR